MAGKPQLPPVRVVQEGEKAPARSISDAIGSRLGELHALRRVMAAHLDSENILARDLAALSRQFREVSKEIEELEGKREAMDSEVARDNDGSSGDAKFNLSVI